MVGALKFAALAMPLAWSFLVVAVSAKHHMSSVSGFLLIESAFIVVQYARGKPVDRSRLLVPKSLTVDWWNRYNPPRI